MRTLLLEDIGLDELIGEIRLAGFHFACISQRDLGVLRQIYETQLRREELYELLEQTDRQVTEIVQKVGYSSSQVLTRVFFKRRQMSPSGFLLATRDPMRRNFPKARGATLAASETLQ